MKLESMKVAVTTASGQLGAAVIKQLVNEIGIENVIGMSIFLL